MKRWKRRIRFKSSLGAKIVTWSFVPSGIILCLVIIVALFALRQTTELSAIEQDREIAILNATEFSRRVRSYVDPLLVLSRRPELANFDNPPQQFDMLNASQVFFDFPGIEEDGFSLTVLDSTGKMRIAVPPNLTAAGTDWSNQPYYRLVKKAIANGEPPRVILSDIVQDPNQQNVIVGSIAILGDHDAFQGVLALMLPVEILRQTDAVENDALESRVAIIVDGQGRVIYHPDPQYVGEDFSNQVAVQHVLKSEAGAMRTTNARREIVVAGYAPIPDTSWGMITEMRWEDVHKRSLGWRYSLGFLLAIAVFLPIIVTSIGAKKIIRPITNLMNAVDGVASGNFDQITTINSGDELEELARQFNVMASKLRNSYAILEQKVVARTRELATLNAIAGVINRSLELDTTLQDTLQELLSRLNTGIGCIYLLNPGDGSLTIRAHQGLDEEWLLHVRQLAPGEGICGRAVATHETIVLNVTEYPVARLAPLFRERNIQTVAAAPILAKGQVLGAIFIALLTEYAFPPEEQALLYAIGQQIGVGIENARLYTQAQQELAERKRAQERLRWVSEERARRNRELLLLNRVIAATTSQMDPNAVLTAVCRELAQAFDLTQSAVAMIDDNQETLTVVAEYQANTDVPSAIGVVFPIAGNLSTEYVLENKSPLAILDAQTDPRLAPSHALMQQRGVKSLLLLPLIVRGEVVGTIGLDSLATREFTQEEVNLAASAVTATAQALEKARAEEELRKSETRYRELFNRSPVGIFRTMLDGTIVDGNQALLDLLGYESVEEGNRVGLLNLYADPEDRKKLLSLIREGPVTNFETRFKRRNGQIIHVSMRATLSQDEEDGTTFVQGTLMDITERREAEIALRESRERLQLAIEGAGLGMWDLNLLTGEQIINYDWWHHLGYAPTSEATHFEDIAQLIHPDDRGKIADAFNDHLSGKEPLYEVEFRLQAQSGEWVWVLFRGKVVAYDDEGKPLRMAGISQNITARKRAEGALRESEERLKVAMEAAGLGLWDQNLLTNELAIANYRLDDPEYCCLEDGMTTILHLEQQIHPDDKGKLKQALEAHLSGAAPLYEVEFRVPSDAGDWHWQLQRGKIVKYDESGQPLRMTGIYEDITARKKAEEDLRQAKEAAEAANRAKSIFLANMSHELRTPLNAILGFTQLMARDQHVTPTQRESLETISRSGQHLLTLINDVLEMSKIEAGRTTLYEENFDLYRMCEALEDMFHLRATQKGLQLLFERAANVPQYVRTDESKLRQVLINLLSNAIKFTEEGGVTVRIGAQEKAGAPDAAAPLAPTPITLHFEVEDTGVGISREDMAILFNPFVQTASGQETKEGTGLGLPISRQYVRLMGGEIAVESEEGRGSLFNFEIQVTQTDAAKVQVEPEPRRVVGVEPGQRASDGRPYRMLIAEDKWTNRQLLVRLLRPLGFELREAINGKEALEVWEEWSPHLIWMDMRMPVMDGHEATQRIKATTKGQATVIIALTASAFEEDRRVILSEGCDDFVRKPFREAEIFEMLEKHLGIRFIYQEMQPTAAQISAAAQDALTAQALSALPAEWVTALHQAALEADTDRLLALADEIRDDNASLAGAIAHVVYEFRFDILLELTRSG
ncbi:MAG: PAS domain-containing protein [Anaerolineae bacterium]|nr:PAS domain-containing protein [Anaerolineae bacterium]